MYLKKSAPDVDTTLTSNNFFYKFTIAGLKIKTRLTSLKSVVYLFKLQYLMCMLFSFNTLFTNQAVSLLNQYL